MLDEVLEIATDLGDRLAGGIDHVEVEQGVVDGAPQQELKRQVVHPLGVALVVALLRVIPSLHDSVTQRKGEAVVPVPWIGGEARLGL